jgi:UDP-N-acetylglucosamine 3-dehydrogenase
LAVHDIGIISFLLERQPTSITSHGSRTHHSAEIDSAEILMDYGHASGFIQANWLTPVKIRTISITGSKGSVEANYITQQLEHYQHNMKKTHDGFSNFVIDMGEPKREVIQVDFQEPLALELKAFLARIRGERVDLVEPFEAREALRLALEAVKPHKEK